MHGRDLTVEWMRLQGWQQPQLADAMQVSQATVSRWLKESLPEKPQREALAELTGKPIDRIPWDDAEAERIDRARKAARQARPRRSRPARRGAI